MTLFAAQTDFTEPGELGLFIDESQVALLEAQMAQKGFLTARQMAATFQMLRSYDLLWSRMVGERSEEHTSELQSLMRISYAVFCLKHTINTRSTKHTS